MYYACLNAYIYEQYSIELYGMGKYPMVLYNIPLLLI